MRNMTTRLKTVEILGSRTPESACLESKPKDLERFAAWRRRLQLIFFGYSDAEITRLGDLSKLTNEHMNEIIHSRSLKFEKTGDKPNKTPPGMPVFDAPFHGPTRRPRTLNFCAIYFPPFL